MATLAGVAVGIVPILSTTLFDLPKVVAADFFPPAGAAASPLKAVAVAATALLRTVLNTAWDLVKILGSGTLPLNFINLAVSIGQRSSAAPRG